MAIARRHPGTLKVCSCNAFPEPVGATEEEFHGRVSCCGREARESDLHVESALALQELRSVGDEASWVNWYHQYLVPPGIVSSK